MFRFCKICVGSVYFEGEKNRTIKRRYIYEAHGKRSWIKIRRDVASSETAIISNIVYWSRLEIFIHYIYAEISNGREKERIVDSALCFLIEETRFGRWPGAKGRWK